MATPRAYRKGYLKLSLVTCPVALYPASPRKKRLGAKPVSLRLHCFIRSLRAGRQSILVRNHVLGGPSPTRVSFH